LKYLICLQELSKALIFQNSSILIRSSYLQLYIDLRFAAAGRPTYSRWPARCQHPIQTMHRNC